MSDGEEYEALTGDYKLEATPLPKPLSAKPSSASTNRNAELKQKYNTGLIQQNSRFWGDNRYWGGHFDDPDEPRAKYDSAKGSHFPIPGSSTTSKPGKPPTTAPYSYKDSLRAFASGKQKKKSSSDSAKPKVKKSPKQKKKASKSK